MLNAQHIGHITPFQGFSQVILVTHSQTRNVFRDQCGGSAQFDLRPLQQQGIDVGQGYPGMKDVSDNYHFFAFHLAKRFPNRKRVQQGLSRVLMCPVSRIYDFRIDVPREKVSCALIRMSHHDDVYLHGQDVVDGVDQGFPLFDGRLTGGEVDDVRRKPFFSQLKGQAGACTVFKEEIGNCDIPQRGHLFDRSVDHLFKMICGFKDQFNVIEFQVFDTE